jgi:curved DNA-binding protein CbpA
VAKDYYQILQVTRTADPRVIDKAYRALSLRYHPDTSGESEEAATGRMRRLNEAYAVLRNPVERARYDATLARESDRRSGWDVFWDEGLIGLYLSRPRSR